jgi:hypothetical protein
MLTRKGGSVEPRLGDDLGSSGDRYCDRKPEFQVGKEDPVVHHCAIDPNNGRNSRSREG